MMHKLIKKGKIMKKVSLLSAIIFSLLAAFSINAADEKMISQYSADLSKSYKLQNKSRTKICLDGIWKISLSKELTKTPPADAAEYGYTIVPSSWLHETDFPIYGTDLFKAGAFKGQGKWKGLALKEYPYAWYLREFSIPADWKDKKIALKLDRVTISGTIFVNGKKVGSQNEHDQKEWDITSIVKFDSANKLSVRVAAFMDEEVKLSLGAEMTRTIKAKASLRGITQDVWLSALPKDITVEDIFVSTSFRKKELNLEITVKNSTAKKQKAEIAITIQNEKDKNEVKKITRNVELNGEKLQTFKLSEKWNDPVLWDTDNPHLYQTSVEVKTDDKTTDTSFSVIFGFRETWIEGKDVLLNGKVIHFRTRHIGSHDALVNTALNNAKQRIKLYLEGGYNSLQLGSEGVWRKGHSAQSYDALLDYANRNGIPVFAPVLPVNNFAWDTPEERAKWEKPVEGYIKKLRNNPSIIMWSLNFNYLGYPWDMNPHTLANGYLPPDNILYLGDKRKKGDYSAKFVASLDPSRVLYHHAGGNHGPMSTSNFYLAWPPLQEREDYFSKWAKEGKKPFYAVELGSPSILDFVRARTGNYNTVRYSEILETEYSAPYLGPEAYQLQEDDYIKLMANNATDKTTAGSDKYNVNSAYFWGYRLNIHEPVISLRKFIYPAYMRAWRTYGVTGFSPNSGLLSLVSKSWQPWHGSKGKYEYKDLSAPGAKPQSYYIPQDVKLSPIAIAYAKSHKPVLIYVGGSKEQGFNAKDHAYFAGEEIKKQIVVVNDLRKELNAEIEWQLLDKTGNKIQSGSVKTKVAPGKVGFSLITIKAPEVSAKSEYKLALTTKGVEEKDLGKWDFAVEVFPKNKFVFKKKVALFDVNGETAKALKNIGVKFEKISPASDLKTFDVIIIGRKSLAAADKVLPGIIKAVNNDGKTLICMSQAKLRIFGIRTHQRGVRRAFILDNDNLVMQGLNNADFENWRGKSTMTNAYPVPSKAEEERYPEEPWQWGNSGVISSYMMEKPHQGNGTALLECEFDLGYSPLIEFNEGAGKIILSQLDLSERAGIDPVATLVLERLLTQAVAAPAKSGKVYACSEKAKTELTGMKALLTDDIAASKVAVWQGSAPDATKQKQIIDFVNNGGNLIIVGQEALKNCSWLPIQPVTKKKLFYRAEPLTQTGVMKGISMADLFIKDKLRGKIILSEGPIKALTKPGIIAEGKAGKGRIIFLTIDNKKYKNSKITPERMNRINSKLNRILSSLIKNSGGSFTGLGTKMLSGNNLQNIPLPSQWKFAIDANNKGRRKKWMKPTFDDSKWKSLTVPGYWESQGVNQTNSRFPDTKKPYDGYAWYRCKINIPKAYKGQDLKLMLGAIDDMDTTYFNGTKIGAVGSETPSYYAFERDYAIPSELIKFDEENTITVKVFDNKGDGGITGPKLYIHTIQKETYPYLNGKPPFNPYKLKRW
jgi:beta-galactosidase